METKSMLIKKQNHSLLLPTACSVVKAMSCTRNWPQKGTICVDEVDTLRIPCNAFDIARAEGRGLPFEAKRKVSKQIRKK